MMRDQINNKEAIEMMERCKHEIQSLRAFIDRLRPKAEAYDNLAILLNLLPKQSVGMGEDLVWRIDKRIRELQPKPREMEDEEAKGDARRHGQATDEEVAQPQERPAEDGPAE